MRKNYNTPIFETSVSLAECQDAREQKIRFSSLAQRMRIGGDHLRLFVTRVAQQPLDDVAPRGDDESGLQQRNRLRRLAV
jgi:hypothetical protein